MTLATRLPPLLLAAVLVHSAVLPQLRVLGVSADLLLLVGVAGGIVAGPDRGAVIGFTSGLLADCFVQTPFGLSALCGALVGFGVGAFQGTILRSAPWIPMVTAMAASAAGVLLFAVAGAVLGEAQLGGGRLVTIAAVVAVANGLLSPLVLAPVRWATSGDGNRGRVLR